MMQAIRKAKGDKVHSRSITVTTYDHDDQRILVEGFLKDDRFQESHLITGETFPGGVIHHMAVRLLINCSSFIIEDVEVDLIHIPREVCRETINCLDSIKGFALTRGFTARAKKLAGGRNGCAHVLELLLAMAPAAIQGYAARQSKRAFVPHPDQSSMILHFLLNTCHVWREDGPFVAKLKKTLHLS